MLYWIGINLDIEELKRAEEQRKTAEQKMLQQEMGLRHIVDLAPQLIAVFGPHLERLYANRMSLDYFGLTLNEWRDTRPGAIGHPDDAKRCRSNWDRALASASAFEIEVRLRRNDGVYRWFLMRCNPVRDDRGEVLRWYAACTDIEDRKQAEALKRMGEQGKFNLRLSGY